MDTARLFQSGRSQAVRLPKKYRFSGNEVVVKHCGNGVLLLPIDDPWPTLEAGLAACLRSWNAGVHRSARSTR
jgi:antitoxin VapB